MIPCWMKAIDIIKKNLKDGGYLGVSDFTVSADSNIFEKRRHIVRYILIKENK